MSVYTYYEIRISSPIRGFCLDHKRKSCSPFDSAHFELGPQTRLCVVVEIMALQVGLDDDVMGFGSN